ncbi:MAG: Uma2 family endonuclease [Chloroflexota bacterium]|nr:Uma2 family endonuclease [Chloroflexota bacterium]
MTQALLEPEVLVVPRPDISHIETEDDTPVDNLFSERQMRLLTDSLYASWSGPGEERTFVAMANVGLFFAPHEDALVPDVLISLDVKLPTDVWLKHNRSYFIWEYGKPPDVVIEIVSNRKGGELGHKVAAYARLGIAYYVVYDPEQQLSNQRLHVYARQRTSYVEMPESWLDDLRLGLLLWQGEYEGIEGLWLRWCDQNDQILLTGQEAVERERQRADQEHQRAERLAAQLRALGIEPDL